MRTPRAADLPEPLLSSALRIARRIGEAGARAWVVGGPVRDLALGQTPVDLDMASALLPERIEALFVRTSAVGKAFGTVLVHQDGLDVQVTTFRRERGFSDARRPDSVEYSQALEEDARRRDFSCNALYLDPLNDELRDPQGGMQDIRERRLRAVGEPGARFAEDGLRLVRMARFHASLDFEVDAATIEAARASQAALAGVSPERRLGELERIFEAPRSDRAVELLACAQLLEALLPGWSAIAPDAAEVERRVRALRLLAGRAAREHGEPQARVGAALGLALLLEARTAAAVQAATALLEFLRPSRALRREIENIWRLEGEAPAAAAGTRARLVRFVREDQAGDALRLARAWAEVDGLDEAALARLAEARASLSASELHPPPWLEPADLERAGLPRGPRWKQVLEAAETEQLEGRLASRAQALRWLEARAAEAR